MNRLAWLQTSTIRGWWAQLASRHSSTAANAYRLLATVCNAAVADQAIVRSPCQVKGAESYKADERPTASIPELDRGGDCRSRPSASGGFDGVVVPATSQRGCGLQRGDIDPLHGEIRIGRIRPKTPAGRRTLSNPPNVLPVVANHVERYVEQEPTAWLFPGEHGRPITDRTLDRIWERARRTIGRPDLHLHDLRQSGLTWAAATGATTAELMHMAGHASPATALRYQHATKDRDRALADVLADLAARSVTPISEASRT